MAPSPGSFPANDVYPGPYGYTGDLPLGTWRMLANGRVYDLDLFSVQGNRVEADMSSGAISDAEWTGFANASTLAELSFTRYVQSTGVKQRFTGFLLHYSKEDPLWRLVGTFGDLKVGTQAGWYATLPKEQ